MNKLKRYFKNSGSIYWTLACFYQWDIKTLFTGELYKPDGKGGLIKYKDVSYYWKRLFNIK